MVEYLMLLLLSFAISLDSFTAGFTFGLRKVRIPLKSIIYIGVVTALVFLTAMVMGEKLATFFTPHIADIIGGVLFVIIGAWVIYQVVRGEQDRRKREPVIVKWEIKSLGIIIQILRDPNSADVDRSGDIKGAEAFLLGAALSLDAFGAGVGAAIFGFHPMLTAFTTATMASIFLWFGTLFGKFFSKWSWVDKVAFFPGIILIFIGFMKLT
ncbi:sporulation membrane protein YtaF [Salirhabdus salicampi]|uniref:sporulation membrane protein YtaF n=1 Tax=Salirhabdus salicampi TaxID=476102 RepID=UPI0020C1F427|nr:sporulation membrane protein YtaF [Salirhabdus salicampi]MCP8617085.1 sporulation membrane protein YtaF [Salirhabdus salicampi]